MKLLAERAKSMPQKIAYRFLADGYNEAGSLSYSELYQRTLAIARELQNLYLPGERVLLLYPSSLDFIASFFGCLHAGMIAVPVCPPHRARPEKTLGRFTAILKSSGAQVIMCPSNLVEVIQDMVIRSDVEWDIQFLLMEECSREGVMSPFPARCDGRTIAALQYTSGTTRSSKAVMVSHDNLSHNHSILRDVLATDEETIFLNWLPFYHDMGLSLTALHPVFCGGCGIFMAPVTFLQNPLRWLAAISKHRATHSSAPNFAYELCVQKITEKEKATLDLSSWKKACNAAEPIRPQTLDQFARAFEPCGLARAALFPGYGLAEATLIVSGGGISGPPTVRGFDPVLLRQNEAIEAAGGQALAASGKPCPGVTLVIVGPDRMPVDDGKIGEIWLASGSVTEGYWQDPIAFAEIFRAYLADGRGPFLRTGDLGFLYQGELYVTGRTKDVIVIRGQKHCPQDLEYTAERSHPALRPDSGAAFSVTHANEERLVIAHELQPHSVGKTDYMEVFGNMQQAIAGIHGLQVFDAILLKAGGLPRTTSGKIQRGLCKDRFLNDSFASVARYSVSFPNWGTRTNRVTSHENQFGADAASSQLAVYTPVA
jgi:acyl-CoA synthetase (AMP-forming)/AMP-acid ligase II